MLNKFQVFRIKHFTTFLLIICNLQAVTKYFKLKLIVQIKKLNQSLNLELTISVRFKVKNEQRCF